MAKITDLPATDALTGAEHLPIVQGTATKRVTMNAFRALITPHLQYWYKGDKGDVGASSNTRMTVAQMRAARIEDVTSLFDNAVWTWTPGDFSGRDNGRTIVGSALQPLTQGAWVRGTQSVSVRDFGAKGDGVTDDTDAIVAAIGAAGDNAVVVFPRGTYVMSRLVRIEGRTNLLLIGQGAVIKGNGARFRAFFKFVGCTRVGALDLTVEQGQSILPTYAVADFKNGILNCALEFDTCTRVLVRGCTFTDLYTSAVYLYASTDIMVADTLFTSPVQKQDQWLQHVHFQTCHGGRVLNCRFINAPITNPATGVCSIYASGVGGYAHFEGNYSEFAGRDNTGTHRLAVIDYYGDAQTPRIINNVSRNGLAQFMRLAAVRGVVFTGNRIHASPNAELDYSMLTIESTIVYAPGQVGVQDAIIRDNLFEDPGHRHAFAIGIISYDWGAPSINVHSVQNTFDGCRRSHLVRGPFFGVTIADNASRGAAGVIQVDHNPSITSIYGTEAGSVMRNLDIRNNKQLDDSGGGAVGISITTAKSPPYTGAVDHIRITDNIIRASAPNSGQGIAVQLSGDVPKGRVLIEGNEIVGYTIGIYQRVAVVATILNNRIVSAQIPILDEGGTGAVDRSGNRYSDGPMRGVARLNGGGVVVPTTEIRAGDIVRLSRQASGGEPGQLSLLSVSDGASLTISSTSATDTSTVLWEIIH